MAGISDRLREIREALVRAQPRIEAMLPSRGEISGDAIVNGAMKMIGEAAQDSNPKRQLHTCTNGSIILAVTHAATQGIVPGIGDEGWLVGRDVNKAGRNDKPRFVRECGWMIGVKGIIRLIHMNPRVQSIVCDVVHENDEFEWAAGSHPDCRHVHGRMLKRGRVECAYLIVTFKNGEKQGEKMDYEDLEKARQCSEMAEAGPWKKWTTQMQRKCVAHRAMKWLPLSDKIRASLDYDAYMQSVKEAVDLQELGAELTAAAVQKAGGAGFEDLIVEETVERDGSVTQKVKKAVKKTAKKEESKGEPAPFTMDSFPEEHRKRIREYGGQQAAEAAKTFEDWLGGIAPTEDNKRDLIAAATS